MTHSRTSLLLLATCLICSCATKPPVTPSAKTSIFKLAASKQQLSDFKAHLDLNPDAVHSVSKRYLLTPLHIAAKQGIVESVKVAISYGADVNARSKNAATPLHLATYAGHLSVMKLLLASGADVNAQDYKGSTPLHLAAKTGDVEASRILIESGTNISLRNNKNHTPIKIASGCALKRGMKIETASKCIGRALPNPDGKLITYQGKQVSGCPENQLYSIDVGKKKFVYERSETGHCVLSVWPRRYGAPDGNREDVRGLLEKVTQK